MTSSTLNELRDFKNELVALQTDLESSTEEYKTICQTAAVANRATIWVIAGIKECLKLAKSDYDTETSLREELHDLQKLSVYFKEFEPEVIFYAESS